MRTRVAEVVLVGQHDDLERHAHDAHATYLLRSVVMPRSMASRRVWEARRMASCNDEVSDVVTTSFTRLTASANSLSAAARGWTGGSTTFPTARMATAGRLRFFTFIRPTRGSQPSHLHFAWWRQA